MSEGHLKACECAVDTADQTGVDQQDLQGQCLAQDVHPIIDAACNRERCGCSKDPIAYLESKQGTEQHTGQHHCEGTHSNM